MASGTESGFNTGGDIRDMAVTANGTVGGIVAGGGAVQEIPK